MSAQGTAYVCRTSIQGETTHNAHTGPGREEVRGHTMRAVYTHNMRVGDLGVCGFHEELMRGGGSARKPHTHTHTYDGSTCAHGAWNNSTHGPHITARVHMGTQRVGGGRGQREGVGVSTAHPNTKHMAIYSLHTRNSTQHCLTEGWQGGGGSRPRWKHNTAQRLQGASHTRTRAAGSVVHTSADT